MTASTARHIKDFHLPYIKALQEMGYQVDVACADTAGIVVPADGMIFLPFEKSIFSLKNWRSVEILKRQMDTRKYDMVLCHTSLASFFTRLAVCLSRRKAPVICTVHGYLFGEQTVLPWKALLVGAELFLSPVTDLLLTMNQWDTQFAKRHRLGKRVQQIPGMGVDFSLIKEPDSGCGQTLRKKLRCSRGDFVLIYAAEFSKRKNQSFLIKAMVGLPESVKLLLPGDGKLRKACMVQAKKLGLAGRVIFPGYVEQISVWYQAADAVVSSSRSEGLPFHLMEAMGSGLPVVASRVKGHIDLVKEGVEGLLYVPGSQEDFQRHVMQLLLDTAYREALGRNAKEAVQAFELSKVLPQVMKCYRQLL